MATLLELAEIEANAVTDPGEPPDPEIIAARDLRARVRTLLYRRAYIFLEQFVPPNPAPSGQEQFELVAFAQRVLRSPDQHVDTAFRMALAQASAAATPAQIVGVTDAQLEAVLTAQRLVLLAKGLRLGQ